LRIRSRRKLNPTRQQFIWCAETTAIDIPKQFRRHAVRGLTREPKLIWTCNRKIAQQIEKMDEQAGGRPQVWKCVARRCPHCRRWWLGIAAQIQHEFESLAWLRGKPMPLCNSTCNNARVMAELFSNPGFLAKFRREPESTAKAILDFLRFPIEFEFSTVATGANVRSQLCSGVLLRPCPNRPRLVRLVRERSTRAPTW